MRRALPALGCTSLVARCVDGGGGGAVGGSGAMQQGRWSDTQPPPPLTLANFWEVWQGVQAGNMVPLVRGGNGLMC